MKRQRLLTPPAPGSEPDTASTATCAATDISGGLERVPVPVCLEPPALANGDGAGELLAPPPHFLYRRHCVGGPGVDLELLRGNYDGCWGVCGDSCSPATCPCHGGGGLAPGGERSGDGGPTNPSGGPPARRSGTPCSAPRFECNSACGCTAADCQNRATQLGLGAEVEVFMTLRCGWGLRARAAIKAGEYCCCYNGEVVTMAEARRRLSRCDADHGSNYLLVVREHGSRVVKTHIDAARVANAARFINHSCEPNLAMEPVRCDLAVPVAALFARLDIAAGTELTFDYSGGQGVGQSRSPRCPTSTSSSTSSTSKHL